MSGSYIATTTEDDVQWLMAAGQSLGFAVAQLRHHLAQALSPAHGALLAEPVEDTAGRATDWYGVGEGEAAPLDQLPPGPRATMTNTVWALLRDIRAEGVRLGQAADSDERVLGAMLEKVSHVPDLSCVRVRDGAPVVIAWAHGRAGASVDLSEVFKPVEVPKPLRPPAPALKPMLAARAAWPGWLLPVLILGAVALVVALMMWRQSQPAETASTSTVPAAGAGATTPVPPLVAATPPRPDPTTPPPARPDATAQAPANASPTNLVPTNPPPAPPDTTAQAPTPPRPSAPPPAQSGSRPTPSPTGSTNSSTTTTAQSASNQAPARPLPDASPSPAPLPMAGSETLPTPEASPTTTPTGSSQDRNQRADATQPAATDPGTPPLGTPPLGTPPLGTSPPETPSAAPTQQAAAQLPPHESEAVPAPRPFTAAAVHSHELRMLQGCWSVGGGFATAEVQTRAAAKVRSWRTCFGPVQPGAASVTGTQLLGWEDGKSCSGPVTARFLPDDRLEIADASDCLGDRTLFRMTEQCTRNDDASMLCSWTAHDRGGPGEFRGDGLSLTPAR